MIAIGIDTGTNTGIAIWDTSSKHFLEVKCLKIHEAFNLIEDYIKGLGKQNIEVYFEDARLRTWFGNSSREKLQGAGSVKRDCSIWEDYLESKRIKYYPIAPKNNITKLNADTFKKITGYNGKTNEHSRDAAMLVFNR